MKYFLIIVLLLMTTIGLKSKSEKELCEYESSKIEEYVQTVIDSSLIVEQNRIEIYYLIGCN